MCRTSIRLEVSKIRKCVYRVMCDSGGVLYLEKYCNTTMNIRELLAPYGQCRTMGCCKILSKEENGNRHCNECNQKYWAKIKERSYIIPDSKKFRNIK